MTARAAALEGGGIPMRSVASRGSGAKASSEFARIDSHMEVNQAMPPTVRERVWNNSDSILANHRLSANDSETVIAVGYVQSGKTTSFTSLIARAADDGYRLIIAMLGSTNLLLAQNRDRLLDALDLDSRHDYKWIPFENPDPSKISGPELAHYMSRDRIVLVTLLKHHGRILDAARVLGHPTVGRVPTLIVDDEADQVSLNTRVRSGDESATYAAIRTLRDALGGHLYVQYTATPYAPLLLEVEDLLSPDFVELLPPGPGYVGGREFFIDSRATVLREIFDGPGPSEEPSRLPPSAETALIDFVVGAALLLAVDQDSAPISMLIHPTGRRDPQRRYEFLVQSLIDRWRRVELVGPEFHDARKAMVDAGCQDTDDETFEERVGFVLNELKVWRINSDPDASDQIRWNIAPAHVLIGGNKLDRGFTVEGLTVTWLGRPRSAQLDTMMQRARAFGYRARYLPYCRIYASGQALDALSASVETELDMRAQLRAWIEEGLPVKEWALRLCDRRNA